MLIRAIVTVCFALVVFCPARAELRFDRDILDLGKIRANLPVEQIVHFQCVGTKSLEIVEIRTECGCIVPSYSKKLYAPGQAGKIPVQIKTLGLPAGPKRWRVHVLYRDDGEMKQASLEITAHIISEISLVPAEVNVHISGPFEQTILLRDSRPKPLVIKSITCSDPETKMLHCTWELQKPGEYVLTLQIQPTGIEGTHAGSLHIYTDDPIYEKISVPVTITKRLHKRVTVHPDHVDLVLASTQRRAAKVLLLRDVNGSAVKIATVSADHAAIQCRFANGDGRGSTVRIQVDREQLTGCRVDGTVQIEISAPISEIVSIPVRVVAD